MTTVRGMVSSDLPSVVQLYELTIGRKAPEQRILEALQKAAYLCLICLENSRAVGFLTCSPAAHAVFIDMLVATNEHDVSDSASHMVNELVRRAKELGFSSILAIVQSEQQQIELFHLTDGYEILGFSRKQYEDRIMYERTLSK
jgi:hypothetical protein